MASETTVVACATGVVRAGISVVRVSGPQAKLIGEKVTSASMPEPNRVVCRTILNGRGEAVDQGLIIFFKGPASFTGEDLVELHTHGSPYIVEQVIAACLAFGAEYARPGEFSERAFLNGKMDLVQVESIADLIASQSSAQAAAALASMQGALSKEVHRLQDSLASVRSQIEADIDFSEQDIDTAGFERNRSSIRALVSLTERLITKVKRAIHNQAGLRIVMVGAPNVGKSSLLNQLTQQDSAIVTDIPGTTRDILKASIAHKGSALEVIDTAGIRDSQDPIEKIGIERTHAAIDGADVVWLLVDATTVTEEEILALKSTALRGRAKEVLVVSNKHDLDAARDLPRSLVDCSISAVQGDHIDKLLDETLKRHKGAITSEFSARSRHLVALTDFCEHLQAAASCPEGRVDCAAEDLRQAQSCLSIITGAYYTDDLLDMIFSTFCLGK